MNKPILIIANKKDNAAIIANESGIKRGDIISHGFASADDIPMGHKISLTNIKKDEPLIRYGEIIGYAKHDIFRGSLIDENCVKLPAAAPLDELGAAGYDIKPTKKLEGYTFLGYKNPDNSVGTKNILGIMSCVQCVEGIINIAVKRIKEELLPRYKNVDNVIPINHEYGCGVAIDAKDSKIPIRILKNLTKNPNFGGEMIIVSLGCEKLYPQRLFANKELRYLVVLQEEAGFDEMINRIMDMAERCLVRLNKRKREVCSLDKLIVGVQCGGSDSLSGVTANPAVGFAADKLVSAGATVLFSEVTEVRDCAHLLIPRTIDVKTRNKMIEEMKWYDDYLADSNVDRDANPTPGNKAGGLLNIVEKSLGSIAKSGTSPIIDVLSPGERVQKKGLVFAATPASDFVCGTCQLASGINMQVFTTGRGSTYGLGMVPVIKVSTNTRLKQKWGSLIDVNAGKIAFGEATVGDVGEEIFSLIIDIASGKKLAGADKYGIENALCIFNPAPIT